MPGAPTMRCLWSGGMLVTVGSRVALTTELETAAAGFFWLGRSVVAAWLKFLDLAAMMELVSVGRGRSALRATGEGR